LACRACKKGLEENLAREFLEVVPTYMQIQHLDQEFFNYANPSAANMIKGNRCNTNRESEMMIRPTFTSNADEDDTRIWLHSLHSVGC